MKDTKHYTKRYKTRQKQDSSHNIPKSILSMKLASLQKGSASSGQASYLDPRKPANNLNNYNNHRQQNDDWRNLCIKRNKI